MSSGFQLLPSSIARKHTGRGGCTAARRRKTVALVATSVVIPAANRVVLATAVLEPVGKHDCTYLPTCACRPRVVLQLEHWFRGKYRLMFDCLKGPVNYPWVNAETKGNTNTLEIPMFLSDYYDRSLFTIEFEVANDDTTFSYRLLRCGEQNAGGTPPSQLPHRRPVVVSLPALTPSGMQPVHQS